MINAFQVYLIMSLDSLKGLLVWGIILSVIALIVCIVVFCISLENYNKNEDTPTKEASIQQARNFGISLSVFAILYVLVPNSKTVAAMIVLPAVTSKDVIQPLSEEARDLYRLAKQAMSDMGKPESKPEKEQ